jgi:hypothetical protein
MKIQIFFSNKIKRSSILTIVCAFILLVIVAITMAPRLVVSLAFGLLNDRVTVRVSQILSQNIN